MIPLLEIPGADSVPKVDALAARLRKLFERDSSIRISRRYGGWTFACPLEFDEFVTPEEIAEMILNYDSSADVRIKVIHRNNFATGTGTTLHHMGADA